MKPQLRTIRIVTGFFLLFLAFIGCQRTDLSRLDAGPFYHADYEGKDVVLRIDSVGAKSVYGRWYATVDERVVYPQHFTATMKRGNEIEVQSQAFPGGMTASVSLDFTSITVDFAKNGRTTSVRFEPLEVPEFVPREGEYLQPTYQVKPPTTVIYGSAKGYWTYYPEPAQGDHDFFNYVKIVAPKVPQLALGEWPQQLEMDVYQPFTTDTMRRPLLMLIHGGAFFNGYKQTPSFSKWCNYFASLGYVVASIDYRLGFGPTKEGVDRAGYKAVQDAHAAMRYLVHHADDYHIDTSLLFVGGSSAGGITALNLAFMRDQNRPTTVVEGRPRLTNADLGLINAVSPQYNENFTIKAVVNMWGALHDTAMLRNSPQTAILSFHGNADGVVAYGHDYPFINPPTPLRDVWALFGTPPDDMKPINELLFDKMYGSSCIHQRAKANGMYSELHTYPGGGHSLHVNSDGTLSDYFHVIQDTTTAFLYQQLVPNPSELVELPDGPQWFGMTNGTAVQSLSWKVEGGVILETHKDRIKAFFFGDATEHKILVSGTYGNGVGLMATYQLKDNTLIKQ